MAETWVINENPGITTTFATINFSSNGNNYNSISITDENPSTDEPGIAFTAAYNTWVWSPSGWTNQAYRTVTFETAPTGDLLTWLQANAEKQTPPSTKLTFDLSDYAGWQALTPGQTYAITLVAHDNDGVYADSDPSIAVNVLRPLDYVYDFSNPPVLILKNAPYSRSAPDAPAIKIT